MADIAVTAAQVAAILQQQADITDIEAGVAVTKGQAVYVDTAGRLALGAAGAAGTAKIRGVCLKAGGIGDVIPVIRRGAVEGYGISALNADVAIFLSNTAGALADAAGTVSKNVGAVHVLPGTGKKVLMLDIPYNVQT